MSDEKKCVYSDIDYSGRVPTCQAGYIACHPDKCDMFTPIPGPPRKWKHILEKVEPLLDEYESANPRADELVFVMKVMDALQVDSKDACFFISMLRKLRSRCNKLKER